MTEESQPKWRFAPTSGGYEQANSAGQYHFAADAFTKMVREVLQNSLDHHQNGLGPVTVTFKLATINPEDIFSNSLLPNIQAANQELSNDAEPDTQTHYTRMKELLTADTIQTLAIIDSNTTGHRARRTQTGRSQSPRAQANLPTQTHPLQGRHLPQPAGSPLGRPFRQGGNTLEL